MSGTPVDVRRTGQHSYVARNDRGVEIPIGSDGDPNAFTPGELLLAAIAGCAGLTGENLLTRRLGEDAELTLQADRTKTAEDPKKFSSVGVSFDFDLSSIADDAECEKLLDAVQRAIERSCTVSRSVKEATPITLSLPR